MHIFITYILLIFKFIYILLKNLYILYNISGSDGLLYLYKNSYEDSDVTFKVTNSKFINNGHKSKSASFTANASTSTVSTAAPVINISDVGQSVCIFIFIFNGFKIIH